MDDLAGQDTTDIEALAYDLGDEVQEETPKADAIDTAEETQGATPQAEPDEQQQEQTQQQQDDPNWNPEGPGNVKIALQKEREALKAEREIRQAVEREAAELRQFRQQIEQERQQTVNQQQAAQYREQLAERLSFVDGEEAAVIVEEIRRVDAQQLAQQYQAYDQTQRLQFSAEVMRDAVPDFDANVNRAYEEFGAALDQLAMQNSPKNPAKWAYELGKRLNAAAGAEDRINAEVEKRLAAKVQEVLQKQTKPDNQGHKTIAHVSSQPVGASGEVDVRKASTADLERRAGLRR